MSLVVTPGFSPRPGVTTGLSGDNASVTHPTDVSAWFRGRPPGEWVSRAVCVDVGLDFADPGDRDTASRAAAICQYRCPVRKECAAYGRAARAYGVWGGQWLRNGRALLLHVV